MSSEGLWLPESAQAQKAIENKNEAKERLEQMDPPLDLESLPALTEEETKDVKKALDFFGILESDSAKFAFLRDELVLPSILRVLESYLMSVMGQLITQDRQRIFAEMVNGTKEVVDANKMKIPGQVVILDENTANHMLGALQNLSMKLPPAVVRLTAERKEDQPEEPSEPKTPDVESGVS